MKKKTLLTLLLGLFLCAPVALGGCGGQTEEPNLSNTDDIKSRDEIISAVGDRYYAEVEFNSTDTQKTTYTIITNGSYTYANLGTEVLLEKAGDIYYSYLKAGEEATKYNTVAKANSMVAENIGGLTELFYATDTINYTSKQKVSFLSRNATDYITKMKADLPTGKAEVYDHVVIDDLTGVCMKHSIEASSTLGGESVSGAASFEMKKFYTGNNSEIGRAIQEEIDKIAVKRWDEAFLQRMGITGLRVFNAELAYASFTEDEQENQLMYTYNSSESKADGFAKFKTYASGIIATGANKDFDGNTVTSYEASPEYNDMMEDAGTAWFRGYTANGSCVSINAMYGESGWSFVVILTLELPAQA